ncbi:hypothetical protein [Flavobacterium sp.]|uniref:hypothetical protein n=1 Tax=Flavobacterium sp. TaxID=239 RepID=UPI003F699E45
MIGYSLSGKIETNKSGYQKLLDFYNYAKNNNNCWFNLDITNLEWIDANLSANLFLFCHLLKKKNNLKFFIDYSTLKGHLEVLNRNGFAYHIVESKEHFKPYDHKDSTIPLKAFKIDDVDGFSSYIENTLLKHRGLDRVKYDDKSRLKSNYFEVFDNVGIHSNTETPIFACGQLFPTNNELKFTLIDYGDGFLKKIAEYTKDTEKIKIARRAIDWAVKGNSTKVDAKGGNGLKGIILYCLKNGGSLHIISDDCYWEFQNKSINYHKLENNIKGVTVNLIFKYL